MYKPVEGSVCLLSGAYCNKPRSKKMQCLYAPRHSTDLGSCHSMVIQKLMMLRKTSVMALTHRVSANGIVCKMQNHCVDGVQFI